MSVYIKLSGGLGNQLFQYAAGKALSLKNNCNLIIDTYWYSSIPNGSTERPILINQLNTRAAYIDSKGHPDKLINPPTANIIKKLYKNRITKEKGNFTYNPEILHKSLPIYLDGYWQSYKYFNHIRNLIVDEFTPLTFNKEYLDYIELLKNNPKSVMMHIRRGDYIHSPSASATLGFIGIDYYHKAIEIIKQRIDQPIFFIFSDDIAWCKEHLPKNIQMVFIDPDSSLASPVDELYLMSLCQHHIIANSSFSWWGAWLSQNASPNVLAPSFWFKNKTYSLTELIPPNWQLI